MRCVFTGRPDAAVTEASAADAINWIKRETP
jgi:hypothetical protein